MRLKYHKDLTLDKWIKFPISQRILMVATELLRAKRAITNNDLEEIVYSYERALELLDLTISTVKGNLLWELCRFRERLALLYYKKYFVLEENEKLYKVLILLNKDAFNMVTR